MTTALTNDRMPMKALFKLIPLLIAAIPMTGGCASEPMPAESAADTEPIPMTFHADAERGGTRTVLNAGNGITWTTSDEIAVFSETGASGSRFKVDRLDASGSVATFSGLSTTSANGYYYALYPYQQQATLVATSGTINAELPTVQTGVVDSFAPEAALSVAQVNAEAMDDADILHFRNVGALLAVKVPGNYVTAIRITSRDGSVAMTGGADIRYNDGEPVVYPNSRSKNYVELTGLAGKIGKTVYAVVYPGEYSQGFEVSFITETTYNTYKSSKALSLKRNGNVYLIDRDWSVNNDRTGPHAGYTRLITPVISQCTQSGTGAVKMDFSCSSGKKTGFKLYVRDASSMGEGQLVATVADASIRSYTFTGLTTGASYDFGVAAFPDPENTESLADSETAWFDDITVNAVSSNVQVTIASTAENYYNLIVNYTISGLTDAGAEHGIVFSSTSSSPTRGSAGAEGTLPGPVLTSLSETTVRQCIPNAVLIPGTSYYVRAYCYDPVAGNYVYSTVSTLKLGDQPAGYSISRTSIGAPANGVSVFSFQADGNYSGWYAVANCSASSSVALKVLNVPSGRVSAAKVSDQASGSDALVLVNGQIFGNYNQGIAYTSGSVRYSSAIAGADEYLYCMHGTSYSTFQPITRAILGVDGSGKPGAYWSSCLADATVRFFDRPIPAGTADPLVYPQVNASSGPGPARNWSPSEALSTGPMLLYGGRVCVSEDRIAAGVYYTNYDLWETTSGNIYGSSRARTAIGYDSATGNVYLCVVSTSITQTGLARVMKGLGCDYAMNLDGGSSSGMYVKGSGMYGNSSRSVGSTVGFFAR